MSTELAPRKRLKLKCPPEVNRFWFWQSAEPLICTMNYCDEEQGYGLYLNDPNFFQNLHTCTLPVLYVYAGYDPDDIVNCELLYDCLRKGYEGHRRPRLTYHEFATTMKIAMQTTTEFRKTFAGMKKVKVYNEKSWKRKVNQKMVAVLHIFSKYFHFGEMEEKDVKKIIVRLLEWAADVRIPPEVCHEIRILVRKIFGDNKIKQHQICRDIFEELRKEYNMVYAKIRSKVTDRYLYAFLGHATRIWPMQGYSIVFFKAILSKQLQRVSVRMEKKKQLKQGAKTIETSSELNLENQVDEVLSPIFNSDDMDKEINAAMQFLVDHLPLIVRKYWCRNFKEHDGRVYMWFDMLALSLTLYAVSVCGEVVATHLELTCDQIQRSLSRELADVPNKEQVLNKVMAIVRQVSLSRGHQWHNELSSMSASLESSSDSL
ncbi:hypothetical protein QR680_019295 [Steinernema hermaphroditum]|uniref:Uncharacterized protein n=1 Tax=Steinernema hermaphroditum TaxID=289476 RepID=A0AA39GPR7_9BILA|nr:hypothetical protein QR680_019295 [Steinernema hermaphroditum]